MNNRILRFINSIYSMLNIIQQAGINKSFFGEHIDIYDQSDINEFEKIGKYCITFYPARPGGSSFTIAKDQDVRKMKELLNKNGVDAEVGFGPYYHNHPKRDPKSMFVMIWNDEKEKLMTGKTGIKKIVYDIIDRNFSLNYPTHQLV